MKDVEKTNVERNNSRKRIRRRGRWNSLYVLTVVALALTVGLTICHTFLFNINEIRVSGESDMYSAEEIVSASGINKGDNLLRLNSDKSEQAILDKLLYVETASVKRKFPASLEIKVTRCIPAYNVFYDGGTLLVSKKGKILADNGVSEAYKTNGLPLIYGYDPKELIAGRMLESKKEHKNEAFSALMSSLSSDGGHDIMSVDMTDEFGIIVNYKNGMIFKMGSWSDVEYKLDLAANVMEQDSVKGKKGYLTMIGTNQCSFRTSNDPVKVPGTTKPNGSSDASNDSTKPAEQDPDQEAIFDEFNNRGDSDKPTEPLGAQPENAPDNGENDQAQAGNGGNDQNDQQDWNDGGNDNSWDDGQSWDDGGENDWDDGQNSYDDTGDGGWTGDDGVNYDENFDEGTVDGE